MPGLMFKVRAMSTQILPLAAESTIRAPSAHGSLAARWARLLSSRHSVRESAIPAVDRPADCSFMRKPIFTVYGLTRRSHRNFAQLAERHRKLEPPLY